LKNINLLSTLKGGLIVSCQAYPGETLFGSDIMAKFAHTAIEGGAVGIRANSPADIGAVKGALDVPVIGIWKKHYADSPIYITPTLKEATAVAEAGADIVAVDATDRKRPNNEQLEDLVRNLHTRYGCLLMADISTIEEGIRAEQIGFDFVSTTMSGYTANSPELEGPDLALISALVGKVGIPVLAEGRIHTPELAKQCLDRGAYAVVVGGAITRPELITKRFVESIRQSAAKLG
jgi:N-acylglucosamine-6-phosphate 2-epimerase